MLYRVVAPALVTAGLTSLLTTGCVPPQQSSGGSTAMTQEELEARLDGTHDDEPAPAEPAVAEPYRNKILFSSKALASDASDADQAFTSWTLGEPLFIHAFGPSPKEVSLFAVVNDEPAIAGGPQVVRGKDAVADFVLDGGGPYPVQGPIGPGDVGAPSPHTIWSNLEDPAQRIWSEFHHRVTPMLKVGDNTLTLSLEDAARKQVYARGTLTVVVPSAAALAEELAAHQEEFEDGDAKLLKVVRQYVIEKMMPTRGDGEAGELVAIGYLRPDWTTKVDDDGVLMQEAKFTVVYRLPSDTHKARCHAAAVFSRRNASSKSGVVWDPPTDGGMALESRWTPCPTGKK